jgi:drug/metabolite transporter (DMT)-like permease
VIQIGDEAVPPEFGAFLRLALASIVLSLVVLFVPGLRFPRGRALRAAALYGVFNFGFDLGLLYWGEQSVPSGIAAIFFATIPLWTLLFAWLGGLEKPKVLQIAGAAVAVVGVVVVVLGQLTTSVAPLALLAALGAATSAALSGVILKMGPRQDAIPANAVGAACGAIMVLAASFLFRESHAFPTTLATLGPVLYLTAFGSLGAYVLWSWLLKTWKASSAAMVAVVVPVLANIVALLVAHTLPQPLTIGGAVLVLVGVAIVLRAPEDDPAALAAAGGIGGVEEAAAAPPKPTDASRAAASPAESPAMSAAAPRR